jgi:DNA-binding response OmpR family regulator
LQGQWSIWVDILNILLVDDDRSLATTLSFGLRKAMGEVASVAVCSNSSEALSMLATQTFDVVSTAYGTDALEEGVRQLGMGYITKPFEPSFLVQMIKGLIQGRETTGSLEKASRIVEKLGKPAGSSSGFLRQGRLYE